MKFPIESVLTFYTGILHAKDVSEFHRDLNTIVGRPVQLIEFITMLPKVAAHTKGQLGPDWVPSGENYRERVRLAAERHGPEVDLEPMPESAPPTNEELESIVRRTKETP